MFEVEENETGNEKAPDRIYVVKVMEDGRDMVEYLVRAVSPGKAASIVKKLQRVNIEAEYASQSDLLRLRDKEVLGAPD